MSQGYTGLRAYMEMGMIPEEHLRSYAFVIYADPSPKQRPRFSSVTKRTYTPEKCHHYQNEVRAQVVASLARQARVTAADFPLFPVDVPLRVNLDFYFKLPRQHPGMNKQVPLYGARWMPKNSDVDNLAKAIFDGLNTVIWEDDRQIVDSRTRKMYADKEPSKVQKAHLRKCLLAGEWPDEYAEMELDTRSRICLFVEPVEGLPKLSCVAVASTIYATANIGLQL